MSHTHPAPYHTHFHVQRSEEPRSSQIPERLCYVGQDQYFFSSLHDATERYDYIYSDSATSCTIAVVQGQGTDNNPSIALCHLSSPQRIQAFFALFDSWFCGGVHLWIQGANPPSAPSSQDNAHALQAQITKHSPETSGTGKTSPQHPRHPWFIEHAELFLLEGDPQTNHRGDWGVDLKTGIVSNRAFWLTHEQRDPSGGVAMLFSMFGSRLSGLPPLWNVEQAYPADMVKNLVLIAKQQGWRRLLLLSPQNILASCSTTPEHEPPWFVESMQESARFVRNYRDHEQL